MPPLFFPTAVWCKLRTRFLLLDPNQNICLMSDVKARYDVRCLMYDVKAMYDVRRLMYDVKGMSDVRCLMYDVKAMFDVQCLMYDVKAMSDVRCLMYDVVKSEKVEITDFQSDSYLISIFNFQFSIVIGTASLILSHMNFN